MNDHNELTLDLFEAGVWSGRRFTEEDIDGWCENAAALQKWIKPRLVIGHTRKDDMPELGLTEQPCVGELKPGSLRRVGKTLRGTWTNVPKIIMDSIRQNRLTSCSIEAYPVFAETRVAKDLAANVPGFVPPPGGAIAALPPRLATEHPGRPLTRYEFASRPRPLVGLTRRRARGSLVPCGWHSSALFSSPHPRRRPLPSSSPSASSTPARSIGARRFVTSSC